jgi:hypothetical protein
VTRRSLVCISMSSMLVLVDPDPGKKYAYR